MRTIITLFLTFTTGQIYAQDCLHTNLRWRTAIYNAREEGKVIFLDFYAPWCVPCKKMDIYTYPDEDVQSIICHEDVLSLKINMGDNNGRGAHPDAVYLQRKYNVVAYPTMIFTDQNGNEIFRTTGFKQPDAFIEWFTEELEQLMND